MAAAWQRDLFCHMSEARLRKWVEANPGRVNDTDSNGHTPLWAAVIRQEGLSLVVWLLDEKGADVNATTTIGATALHYAKSLDTLIALLDRGANPTIADRDGESPLIWHAFYGSVDNVARLLQDPRVRATVNAQRRDGFTALHAACHNDDEETAATKVSILLQVGANPTLTRSDGQDPLAWLRQRHPTHHAAIALLEQALVEAEEASLLAKARRLALAANSNVVAPSCLQARVALGQPLPHIALGPPMDGQNDGKDEEGEEGRKLRTALAFMCGVGREGMPRDVFRGVFMDLVMPSWDPLRCKDTGAVPQMPPQG